jgi:hypothetical protein
MPVPRRDFMKLFGISLGSLLLARCQRTGTPDPTIMMTCYEPTAAPRNTPTSKSLSARGRLRLCWLRFGELAETTRDGTNSDPDAGDRFGRRLVADHRAALDELVGAGEITAPVADLIQEAYTAAVYHIWRSNAPMTCYAAVRLDYAPVSANNLVLQSEILSQVGGGGTIAPDTIAKARAALEHDLAFYALSDADVQALYKRLLEEYDDPGEAIPSFAEVELALTPDVRAAAQFLLEVLMGI